MLIRGLIALAFGTLGLGITEYVAMGLLPYWASYFEVSIAQAGHAISAYAIGVAVGAFSIILLRKMKLKNILLLLIVVHILGNAFSAFAPTFDTLLISRFIAGLPHGSYFGAGSIIAQRLAAKGKGTSAVSIMVAGMTVANIFGVPLGTALANSLSWRIIFYIVSLWGVLVLVSVMWWVRDVGKIKDSGFKGQFVFLRDPAPWWVLAATMFGNAGIFCMHSYISPILTDQAGIPLATVSAVMAAMGVSMVIANLVSGRLCDRFTPGKVAFVCQTITIFVLLGISSLGYNPVICIILVCLAAGMLFAVSSPEQVAILHVSPGGLLLGASMVQAAFNLGNAIGAYVGGVPFTLGMSINYVTILGAILAAVGAFSLYIYSRKHENRFTDTVQEDDSQPQDATIHQDAILQDTRPSTEIPEFGMSDELMAQYHAQKAAAYAAKASYVSPEIVATLAEATKLAQEALAAQNRKEKDHAAAPDAVLDAEADAVSNEEPEAAPDVAPEAASHVVPDATSTLASEAKSQHQTDK